MSELSFEQMLEESLKTIRTGEVVTGRSAFLESRTESHALRIAPAAFPEP